MSQINTVTPINVIALQQQAAFKKSTSAPESKSGIHTNNVIQISKYVERKEKEEVEVIQDNAKISCEFNIMADRPVRETLSVKEYRIRNLYGEATFDREYFSSMEKSPDHLIMLTAQAHTQKLIYLTLNKYFGYQYNPEAKENLKIWPTAVSIRIPKMIRDNTDVVQKLWIKKIEKVGDGVFNAEVTTSFNGSMELDVSTKVYLIAKGQGN